MSGPVGPAPPVFPVILTGGGSMSFFGCAVAIKCVVHRSTSSNPGLGSPLDPTPATNLKLPLDPVRYRTDKIHDRVQSCLAGNTPIIVPNFVRDEGVCRGIPVQFRSTSASLCIRRDGRQPAS